MERSRSHEDVAVGSDSDDTVKDSVVTAATRGSKSRLDVRNKYLRSGSERSRSQQDVVLVSDRDDL